MTTTPSEDFSLGQKTVHLLGWLGSRLRGRDYPVDVEIFGQRMSFVVRSRRELKRVSEVSYEGDYLRRIVAHLRKGDVLFDVGANIGLVSVILGRQPTMASGRIHAFEPEARNLAQLRRNLQVNGFGDRAVAEDVALAAAEGRATLHVRGPVGDGRHSLVASRGATGAVEVAVTTMSAYCVQRGVRPDVVKIDVEGAEGEVLAGMDALLAEGHPRELFLEIHNKGGKDRMPDGSGIEDFLQRHGYACTWRENRGSGQHQHYRRP
jgi:FkbM family methyltransferase